MTMLKHTKLTEARIKKYLGRIKAFIHPEACHVTVEAWPVNGEPIPLEEAVSAEYKTVSIGYEWGPAWATTWFRIRGEDPVSWKGRDVVALIKLNNSGREGFRA